MGGKSIAELQAVFKNLPLVLEHKGKVLPAFRNYTGDLTFDLQVYRQYFDEIDRSLAGDPAGDAEKLRRSIIETEGKRFRGFFEQKLVELGRMVAGFGKEEHEVHGFYFRKQVWDFILRSEFMRRTNLKPRGYAGDSEMMRMIYENAYRGDSIFSRILYRHSIEHPGAQAVRNRRLAVPTFVRKIHDLLALPAGTPFQFLSVACGPAYELQEIYLEGDDPSRFHCTLLDQDPAALGEARECVAGIGDRLGAQLNARYLQESVRTMLRSTGLADQWGRFHCVYSMGLFDYLTPPVARAVIEKMYDLLEPGGTMLVGNFHTGNPSRWFMEYWHDWVLYYRTEEEFIDLLRDTGAVEKFVIFEASRSQMFLTARKPA